MIHKIAIYKNIYIYYLLRVKCCPELDSIEHFIIY